MNWEFRTGDGNFLPIEVPGPWQRVWPDLHGVGEYRTCIDWTDDQPFYLRFEAVACHAELFVNGVRAGGHTGSWTPFVVDLTPHLQRDRENELRLVVDQRPQHVTTGFLPVICAAFGGIWGAVARVPYKALPERPPADPKLTVRGERLFVDGRPIQVRGLLHWGYYPEHGAPRPSRGQIEREVEWMLALGFNLVKFCLFAPPEEYLQVCDERGLLVWQEYPVWDRALTDRAVIAEFEELVVRDAPYRSVILRTLTCENREIDPDLAREVVDLVKRLAPGGLVLDNSSFLFNERLGDFHDEHPYLHPAAWRHYPGRMRSVLAGLPAKPLLLGETMAVDAGPGDHRLAVSVRKDQVEILRRGLPGAGYVMNSIRDIPAATLGFCDVSGEARFGPSDFAWQRDSMILIDQDDRSFFGGTQVRVGLLVSHFGAQPLSGSIVIEWEREQQSFDVKLAPGETRKVGELLVRLPEVREPTPVELRARLLPLENRWTLWALPPCATGFDPRVQVATPRAGSLRCPQHHFLSPVFEFHADLPELEREFVSQLLMRDLLSGRVLHPAAGFEPLLEIVNLHDRGSQPERLSLVAATRRGSSQQLWSALRHDTPAGLWLLGRFSNWLDASEPRTFEHPVATDSIFLEEFHRVDGDQRPEAPVRVGQGLSLCGKARLVTRFRVPDEWHRQPVSLCSEGVGDGFRVSVDGRQIGQAGNLVAAWDSCRFQHQRFPVTLDAGLHELELEVRDWCGGGILCGAIWWTRTADSVFY